MRLSISRNLFRGVRGTLALVAITGFFLGDLMVSARQADVDFTPHSAQFDLDGAIGWLNSPSLNPKSLRGKVVLVDFWTYTCVNSLRPLPYVKSWAVKYKDAGLVVIGVHTPEFSFEREPRNVQTALRALNVTYLIPIDSKYSIWKAFNNEYWPAQYFIDGHGRIRYQHFGEGEYARCERMIQELLRQIGAAGLDGSTVTVSGNGIEAAPSADERSAETYIGYRQAERFSSLERLARNSNKTYAVPGQLALNRWGLTGVWNVGAESAEVQEAHGSIVFRFHSRDLHMVLAPRNNGEPIRFKVKLDGGTPGDDHGVDTAPDGSGEITEPRLYQLIRQKAPIKDRTFTIEFLDTGARAFNFTFG